MTVERWVHWDEPGLSGNEHRRITVDEAVRRARVVHVEMTDADALREFIVIHWAWVEVSG